VSLTVGKLYTIAPDRSALDFVSRSGDFMVYGWPLGSWKLYSCDTTMVVFLGAHSSGGNKLLMPDGVVVTAYFGNFRYILVEK
jgi:hypothetical protein